MSTTQPQVQPATQAATVPTTPIRCVAFASMIGTLVEWYDYFIDETKEQK